MANSDTEDNLSVPPRKRPRTGSLEKTGNNTNSKSKTADKNNDDGVNKNVDDNIAKKICPGCHQPKDLTLDFTETQLKKKKDDARCKDCISASLNPEGSPMGRCTLCQETKHWFEFKKREKKSTTPTCIKCRHEHHYIVCGKCQVKQMKSNFSKKQRRIHLEHQKKNDTKQDKGESNEGNNDSGNHDSSVKGGGLLPICNTCKQKEADRLNQLPRKCSVCKETKPRDEFSQWKDVESWNATLEGWQQLEQTCLACISNNSTNQVDTDGGHGN